MFSKYWLMNIVLAAGVIFFAVKTHEVWFSGENPLESEIPPAKEESENEKQFTKPNLPLESTYRTFVDRNLFSEDRAEYLPPAPEPELSDGGESESGAGIKPLEGFGQKVTLYGVFIYKDVKKALITNPGRERGQPKDIWVEKGDVVLEVNKRDHVATLTVDEILEDRLLIKDGADRYEVLLYDKENPKKRPTVKKDEIPVVVTPKKAAPKKSSRSTKRPGTIATKPAQDNVQKETARTAEEDKGSGSEFEIINTPFGEIKRRKK